MKLFQKSRPIFVSYLWVGAFFLNTLGCGQNFKTLEDKNLTPVATFPVEAENNSSDSAPPRKVEDHYVPVGREYFAPKVADQQVVHVEVLQSGDKEIPIIPGKLDIRNPQVQWDPPTKTLRFKGDIHFADGGAPREVTLEGKGQAGKLNLEIVDVKSPFFGRLKAIALWTDAGTSSSTPQVAPSIRLQFFYNADQMIFTQSLIPESYLKPIEGQRPEQSAPEVNTGNPQPGEGSGGEEAPRNPPEEGVRIQHENVPNSDPNENPVDMAEIYRLFALPPAQPGPGSGAEPPKPPTGTPANPPPPPVIPRTNPKPIPVRAAELPRPLPPEKVNFAGPSPTLPRPLPPKPQPPVAPGATVGESFPDHIPSPIEASADPFWASLYSENRPRNQAVRAKGQEKLLNPTNLLDWQNTLGENAGFKIMFPQLQRHFATYDLATIIAQTGHWLKSKAPPRFIQVSVISRADGKVNCRESKFNGKNVLVCEHKEHRNGLMADLGYLSANQKDLSQLPTVVKQSKEGRLLNQVTSEFLVDEQWNWFKKIFTSGMVNYVFTDATIKEALCKTAVKNGEISTTNNKGFSAQILQRLIPDPQRNHANHFHLHIKCLSKFHNDCQPYEITNQPLGCQLQ